MGYLIAQILFCLIIAALIGLLLGLLIGRLIWGRWREAYDDAELRLNKRERDYDAIVSSLAARTSELDTANTSLQAANERVTSFEGEIETSKRNYAELESRFSTQETELGTLRPLRGELESRDATITDLNARLGTLEAEKDAELKRLRTDLEKSQAAGNRAAELESQLAVTRKDLDARTAAETSATERLTALEADLSEKDTQLAELSRRSTVDVDELQGKLSAIEDELSYKNQRLTTVEAELAQAQEGTAESGELRSQLESLRADLNARDSRITELEAQTQTPDVDVDALQSELASLRGSLNIREDRIAQLEAKTSSSGALEQERDTLQERLSAQEARVAELESQLAAKPSGEDAARLESLQTEVNSRNERIRELEAQLASAGGDSDEVTRLTSQLASLQGDLGIRSSRIAELEGQVNDPERALSLLSGRYTLQRPNLAMRFLGGRVRLRGYLPEEARNDVITRVNDALGEGSVLDELRSDDVVSVPTWMPDTLRLTPDLAKDLQDGSLRVDERGATISGIVAEEAQRDRVLSAVRQRLGDELTVENRLQVVGEDIEADDLKEIKGIETVLEPVMHSIGVYTFRQIARWSQEDVEQVRDSLDKFKTRIERENWIEQARELHREKYGEDVG